MRFLNPLDEHVKTPLCLYRPIWLTLQATISEYVGLPQ